MGFVWRLQLLLLANLCGGLLGHIQGPLVPDPPPPTHDEPKSAPQFIVSRVDFGESIMVEDDLYKFAIVDRAHTPSEMKADEPTTLGSADLRTCAHLGLEIAPSESDSPALAIEQVIVELITVSNYSYPRNGLGHDSDTAWYNGPEHYGCHMNITKDMTWLDPTAMRTPQFMQAASDTQDVEDEMLDYWKDVTGVGASAGKSQGGARFFRIPTECQVHVRRLPIVQTGQYGKGIYAPFSPDPSSDVYFFRLSILPPIVTHEDAPTSITDTVHVFELPVSFTSPKSDVYPHSQCFVPDRMFNGQSVVIASDQMSTSPSPDDNCWPILHCPFCPLATHFGLFKAGEAQRLRKVWFLQWKDREMSGLWSSDDALHVTPLDGSEEEHLITAVAGKEQRLVVRALAEIGESLPHASKHSSFFGRLVSKDRIVNAHFPAGVQYSEEEEGYVVTFTVRETGAYLLEVYLSWVYGDCEEFEGPEPVLVGPHMGHKWNFCNHRRAMIYGSPWVVNVIEGSDEPQVWGFEKCKTANEEGRWVLMETNQPCAPPLCSGLSGETVSIEAMGWHGERNQWVWVPYTCYYHLYSKDDMYTCAKQTGIDWLLIQGDSQVRELMEHLHLVCGYSDVFGKFAALERPALVQGLRVTFQFFEYAFNSNGGISDSTGNKHPFGRGWWPYLEHFNILPSCTSGRPISEYVPDPAHDPDAVPISKTEFASRERLRERETTRPDAWVWNLSMAYGAQDMPWSEFARWVEAASQYLAAANLTTSPADPSTSSYVTGHAESDCRNLLKRGESNKQKTEALKKAPLKTFWYRPPFTFSQAHAGSEWLSQARVSKYDDYAWRKFKSLGIEILDTTSITQSRMEDSWDGLHYMRSTIEDPGHGLVSAMVQQTILNAIFGSCGEVDPESTI